MRHGVLRMAWLAAAVCLAGFALLWTQALFGEVTGPQSVTGHHDFFAFYSAATAIRRQHPNALYSATAITATQRTILAAPSGAAGYMPFLNPPYAAVVQSPLAWFSEPVAREVWLVLTLACVAACGVLIAKNLQGRGRCLAVLPLLATFPTYQTLAEGQWSFVLLLGCLLAHRAADRDHPWRSGVALAVFGLKPPLLMLVLIWLVVRRSWRIAAGAVLTVAGCVLVTLPWTGLSANAVYGRYLAGVSLSHLEGAGAIGPTAWQGGIAAMQGLNGLAATLVGQRNPLAGDVLYAGAAAALVAALAWRFRPWIRCGQPLHPHEATRMAIAAACLGLLLDPHLYPQDCVLAVFPAMLAMRNATPRVRLGLAVAVGVILDLIAIDTVATDPVLVTAPHVFTVTAMICVLALSLPATAFRDRRFTRGSPPPDWETPASDRRAA